MNTTRAAHEERHSNGGGPLQKLAAFFQRRRAEENPASAADPEKPSAYEWRSRNNTPTEVQRSLTALYDGYITHEWLRTGERPDGAAPEAGSETMPLEGFTTFTTEADGKRVTRCRSDGTTYRDPAIAELAQATVHKAIRKIRCASGWTPWPWEPSEKLALREIEAELHTDADTQSRYYILGRSSRTEPWRTQGTILWAIGRRPRENPSPRVRYYVKALTPTFDWLMETLDNLQEAGLAEGLTKTDEDGQDPRNRTATLGRDQS